MGISLRYWRRSDCEAYVNLIHRNVERLGPVATWATSEYSASDYLSWLKGGATRHWRFAILSGPEIVGSLCFEEMAPGVVQASYWLDRDSSGKGFTNMALRMAESVLLEDGVKCIEIHFAKGNDNSRRVAEQAGYQRVGEYSDRPSRPGVTHYIARKVIR